MDIKTDASIDRPLVFIFPFKSSFEDLGYFGG